MDFDCAIIFEMSGNYTRIVFPDRPVQAVIGMLSFFSVLGTLGNALVLYVYVRKKNKIASTIFIICLACTDFFTSCVIMPFTMVMESMDYSIKHDSLCKVYYFLITCNVPFSAFIMVAIAIDRYLCICRPHCHVLDPKVSQIIILFLALAASLFGVVTALSHGVYTTENFSHLPNASAVRLLDTMRLNFRQNEEELISERHDRMNEQCWQNQSTINNGSLLETLIDCLLETFLTNCRDKDVPIYTSTCLPNEIVFSTFFRKTYQKIYASMFLVSFIIVFLLYIAIYRSVLTRRSKRLRARQKTNLRLLRDVSVTDTQVTAENAHNGFEVMELQNDRKKVLETDTSLREKYLLANIRTALMLFVVTLVFILTFLPSWLMAHTVVSFNAVVFYLYFAYNVSNPIIYAFMNPTFRRELRDVVSCRNVRNAT